jgi:hypothetical protein
MASAHTPGPEPVNARVLPLPDVEPAVALAVAGVADVLPAAPCVALALDDCELELAVGAGTKEIKVVTWGSLGEESPNASTHESPAVSCAAVGGHG